MEDVVRSLAQPQDWVLLGVLVIVSWLGIYGLWLALRERKQE